MKKILSIMLTMIILICGLDLKTIEVNASESNTTYKASLSGDNVTDNYKTTYEVGDYVITFSYLIWTGKYFQTDHPGHFIIKEKNGGENYVIKSLIIKASSSAKGLQPGGTKRKENVSYTNVTCDSGDDEVSYFTPLDGTQEIRVDYDAGTHIIFTEIEIEYELGCNHSYSEEWSNDENNHWHECEECGDKKDSAEHNWNAGVVTTPPTIDALGEKVYTCEICGRTKTDSVGISMEGEEISIELDGELTYNENGQTQGIIVKYGNTVLTEGTHYTVTGNNNTNAGTYTLTITGLEGGVLQGTKSITYEIKKAPIDLSGVEFADKTVTYDGAAHALEITGTTLPDGVTVSYENNNQTEPGVYPVKAVFTKGNNYESCMEATLTINKITVDRPAVDNTVFTYNGEAQTYTVAGSEHYTVGDTTTATEPGEYPITISLNDKAHYQWDNGSSDDLVYSFVINKMTYDMSGISFPNKTVTYNGEEHSIEIAGELPDGVTVTYENNGKKDIGVYTVIANFVGETDYHNPIESMSATLTIKSKTAPPSSSQPGSSNSGSSSSESSNSGTSSSGSTSGISNNGTQSEVSIKNNETVVDVTAKVEENKVTVEKIKDEELSKVIDSKENTTIEFDFTEMGKKIDTVVIPTEAFEKIANSAVGADNNVEGLTIKISTATVTLDATALQAVVSQAKGDNIQLSVDDVHTARLNAAQMKAIERSDVHRGIDAYFICNGQRIGDFKGGEVTIRLPFEVPQGYNAKNFRVWYIADDGFIEKYNTQYVNGELVFKVSHFSDYIVVYDGAVKDDVPKTGEAADYTTILWITILAIGVVGLVLNRQKRRQ